MNILFSGTSDFSLPVLEYIHKKHNIVGIITSPDKPQGRGLEMKCSPVKEFALKHDIKYFDPIKLNNIDVIKSIKKVKSDFLVSIAGRIIPEEILGIPKIGCINIHPSLLPGYPGPAPVQWVLFNNEEFTGITSHLMSMDIDKGKIIYQKKIALNFEICFSELYEKLSNLSVEFVDISFEKVIKNEFLENLSDIYKKKNFYARKLKKEDFFIKWNSSSLDIYNLVRGLNDCGIARTYYNQSLLKIFKVQIVDNLCVETDFKPGQVVYADKKNGLVIKTKDGYVKILKLQRENRKILDYINFLNGTKIKIGEFFKNVQN